MEINFVDYREIKDIKYKIVFLNHAILSINNTYNLAKKLIIKFLNTKITFNLIFIYFTIDSIKNQ